MAYDESLAARVRLILAEHANVIERKMMGALCFMIRGHMSCGVSGASLMVRVGREAQDEVLAMPHVRLMQIGGQPVAGFILVDMPAMPSDEAFAGWVQRGIDFVSTLPPK
ncbi:RNA methyltransferase [Brucella anthropi]|uniref:TfoX/Sxy family protein n=1 Tax=Brucella anthropi TaxID=529 RepID=UPI000450E7AB|nr:MULTISPECIES: TfoX/Sxy family protein [Brucella]EXL01505.1 RNA methyltransferase [Brucella anthropi]WKT92938.1 TfoX/Sxy family protein [Brucella anthropi]